MNPNPLNLPTGSVWDVFDAKTAERRLHNATVEDVNRYARDHREPFIMEPVGMRPERARLEGRADKKGDA